MNKESFISIFKSIILNLEADDELEIKYRPRFQGFESKKFIPSISCDQFYNFIKIFRQNTYFNTKDMPMKFYTSTNPTYPKGHKLSFIRRQVSLPQSQEKFDIITKKVRKNIDQLKDMPNVYNGIFPHGFKVSLQSEKECDAKTRKEYLEFEKKQDTSKLYIRTIERHSFTEQIDEVDVFRYDVSKIYVNNKDTKFEIEMEYIGGRDVQKIAQKIATTFVERIVWILKTIQNSDISLSLTQHNTVFTEYVKLVGLYDQREDYGDHRKRDVFIGCQPESMHYRNLNLLWDNDYIVLDKSDGERSLIFINSGSFYCIDRFMHISKLNVKFPSKKGMLLDGTLLDTEIFKDKSLIVVFDMLFFNSQDYRPYVTANRIEKARHIIEAISDIEGYTFDIKEYIRWQSKKQLDSATLKKLMQKNYKTDGFICVPNSPCPRTRKWSSLLKWKPSNLNSIDLYVEPIKDTKNSYNLMVQTNLVSYKDKPFILFRKFGTKNSQIFWLIDFNNEIIEVNKNIDEYNVVVQQSVCIPFPFQPTITTKNRLMPFSVYEFIYNFKEKTLNPVLLRRDKTSKGYLGSNHLTVATDIWDSVYHPVNLETFDDLNDEKVSTYYNTGFNHPIQMKKTLSPLFDLHPYESLLVEKNTRSRTFTSKSTPRRSGNNRDSPIWRIKAFHNHIKRHLIDKCSQRKRLTVHEVFNTLNTNFNQEEKCYEFKNWNITYNWLLSYLNIERDSLKQSEDKLTLKLSKDYVDELLRKRYESSFDLSVAPSSALISSPFSVLDLCSGKGGDLWKYAGNDIDLLVCVDNEKYLLQDASSDCALKRWKDIKKETNTNMKTIFIESDVRSDLQNTLEKSGLKMDFDIVSCFFALHYLFESENSLHNFMKNVSNLLTYRGYFIGTMVDGERVYNELKNPRKFEHTLKELNRELGINSENDDKIFYSVKSVSESINNFGWGELNTFGNEIDVTLNDSIIHEYIDRQESKKEYLVNFDSFVDIAKHYDLELIDDTDFSDFYPEYHGSKLSKIEKRFSFINRTFTFRKISNSNFHKKDYQSKLTNNIKVENLFSTFSKIEENQLETMKLVNEKTADNKEIESLSTDNVIHKASQEPTQGVPQEVIEVVKSVANKITKPKNRSKRTERESKVQSDIEEIPKPTLTITKKQKIFSTKNDANIALKGFKDAKNNNK